MSDRVDCPCPPGQCAKMTSEIYKCTLGDVRAESILWIIESRTAGAWSTSKPEVAAKHAAKPDSIVTPYQSKRHLIKG